MEEDRKRQKERKIERRKIEPKKGGWESHQVVT